MHIACLESKKKYLTKHKKGILEAYEESELPIPLCRVNKTMVLSFRSNFIETCNVGLWSCFDMKINLLIIIMSY